MSPGASELLHRARAILCLTVLVAHARSGLFLTRPELLETKTPTGALSAFYLLTGFGSQAVVLFFVVSGYVISRKYWLPLRTGTLSLAEFALSRAVRVYLVLLPAVAITLLTTALVQGSATSPAKLFNSASQLLLFLQPGWFPWPATNAPLWSLSYEVVAYGAFAALIHSTRPQQSNQARTLSALVAVLFLALGGLWSPHYIGLFLIGAVAGVQEARSAPKVGHIGAVMGILTVLLAAALVASRTTDLGWPMDWFVALPFGGLCACLESWVRKRPPTATRLFPLLSGFSFTLYVTHFPIIELCRSLLDYQRVTPSLPALAAFGAIVLVAIAFAGTLSEGTEAQTAKARAFFIRMFRPAQG